MEAGGDGMEQGLCAESGDLADLDQTGAEARKARGLHLIMSYLNARDILSPAIGIRDFTKA